MADDMFSTEQRLHSKLQWIWRELNEGWSKYDYLILQVDTRAKEKTELKSGV